jgi:hypothetical protein
VVARPERHDDERQITLERDLRDRSQRAVASGHPERAARGARDTLNVLARLEHMHVDPSPLRFAGEVVGVGAAASGARVHNQ